MVVPKERRENGEQVEGEGVDTSGENVGTLDQICGALAFNLTPCTAIIIPLHPLALSPIPNPCSCARHRSNGPTCRAEFMKHVLPRLVRPQMPGWPWKSSSSSGMLFLGLNEKPYELRAYYRWVFCIGRFCMPTMGYPNSARHPQGSHATQLCAGPSAIFVSGLHDDQLG